MAIRVVATAKPDFCWIETNGGNREQVGWAVSWQQREGTWYAYISRNRIAYGVSEGGIPYTPTQFASFGNKAERLKGKVFNVVVGWNITDTPIRLTSVSVDYELSSGQT